MFKMIANLEQVRYARELFNEDDLSWRGEFDGDEFQKFFGLLGEVVVCDWLGVSRPSRSDGFDGGYDLEFNGLKIDVKTAVRNVKPLLKYGCNVPASQMDYSADTFIFLSYDKVKGEFWFLGWISKEDFISKALFRKKGSTIPRDDGRLLISYDFYEVTVKQLIRFTDFRDFGGLDK